MPAAELTRAAQQQRLLHTGVLGFKARLDRLAVGEGLALAQATVAVAPLLATHDRRHGCKSREMGCELQPEAMGLGSWRQGDAAPWAAAAAPIQAQRTHALLQAGSMHRFLNQGQQRRFRWWRCHRQQGRRTLPALQMGAE